MATPEVRPQQVGPGLMSWMIVLGPWHLGWWGENLVAISWEHLNVYGFCLLTALVWTSSLFSEWEYDPEVRNCKGWPLE